MTKKSLIEDSVTICAEILNLSQQARREEGESVVWFCLGLLSAVVLMRLGFWKYKLSFFLCSLSLSLPGGVAEMLQDEALHISPKIRASSSKEDMATAICK